MNLFKIKIKIRESNEGSRTTHVNNGFIQQNLRRNKKGLLHNNFPRLVLLVLISTAGFYSVYSQGTEAIKAVRRDKAPVIDGRLDDESWTDVPVFSNFRMVEPVPGSDPTEQTEIKVIYNNKSLYIAVRCFEKDPRKISANSMQHDNSEERNEDMLSLLIDPFQDKRNAYMFIVNPRGARSEGFASGEHLSLAWDGLWDAKCRIDNEGWTAEIEIPFHTISFNPKLTEWGINIERYIARKQEVIRYSGINLNSFFANPREAGVLEGIGNIKPGLGITIRPSAKASMSDSKTDSLNPSKDLTGGIDIYKNITPNLTAALTINTDFAETEVDERKLNLTRFPLYYPEKRTFFLEGSDVFEFGSTSSSSFIPFFSRRIGLIEGEPVPLQWGGKVYGKVGNTNISMLDVQSSRSGDISPANMFAARISQNIFDESRVGMILTNGSQNGTPNTLAGADFRYKTSRLMGSENLSVDIWGVKNWNEAKEGNKSGYGVKIDYPNDLIDAAVSYTYFGDSIDPGLGFLPRKAYHSLSTSISYMPRPEKGFLGNLIRQWFFQARLTGYWDLQGEIESMRIFTAPVNFRTESGEHIEFNIILNREVLPEDFEIADGVIIPKGDYKYISYAAQASTASHRKAIFDVNYNFGGFYDGSYNDLETEFSLKLNGYATMQIGGNFVRGVMPEGNFNENVYFTRINLFLSPDLGINNYLQFDDVTNKMGYNGRFFWQIRPGNIIYFVYNNNTLRVFDPDSRFKITEDEIIFKIQMSIRF